MSEEVIESLSSFSFLSLSHTPLPIIGTSIDVRVLIYQSEDDVISPFAGSMVKRDAAPEVSCGGRGKGGGEWRNKRGIDIEKANFKELHIITHIANTHTRTRACTHTHTHTPALTSIPLCLSRTSTHSRCPSWQAMWRAHAP